ncbi:MAG: cytochrome c maturation protein CcmE [Chloroflexota bacterium]
MHGAPARLSGTQIKLVVAAGCLIVAVAYLVSSAIESNGVYYLTVEELRSSGAQASGRQVRVAGDVTPGTVQKEEAGLAVRFMVQDGSGQIPVYYRGKPVPDIFGENVQVVVEGKYGTDGTFVASTLLAKCPSKFEADSFGA